MLFVNLKDLYNGLQKDQTFHYTRRITPKRVTRLRCHLRVIAPRQHSYLSSC